MTSEYFWIPVASQHDTHHAAYSSLYAKWFATIFTTFLLTGVCLETWKNPTHSFWRIHSTVYIINQAVKAQQHVIEFILQTSIHTSGHFRMSNPPNPNPHVFELWIETGVTRENPHRDGEDMQTPNRKALNGLNLDSNPNLLAVRQQCKPPQHRIVPAPPDTTAGLSDQIIVRPTWRLCFISLLYVLQKVNWV